MNDPTPPSPPHLSSLYLCGTSARARGGSLGALGGCPVLQGACLWEGRGCARDRAAATACFRRAAGAGLPEAQFNLGLALWRGDDGGAVGRDLAGAVAWYERAALAGQPDAQYNLGNAYKNGEGVARDMGMAA